MKTYNFEVETKESGQRRKYGDSFYHYIIKNNCEIDYDERIILKFCTGFLNPAIPKKERDIKKKNNFDAHFFHYYTDFRKISDRTYEYKVVHPSTL